jgi:hypothetical protein
LSDRVFVNYRQRGADGGLLPHVLFVEALADRLGAHFGGDTVYLDTTLRPGHPYPEALRARVADAAVLLVVIHPGWSADMEARAGRHKDWVQEEIATAIEAGIRLLPVLLDGAEQPAHAGLPPAIRALADAQAVPLRFGSLAGDIAPVIAEIEMIVAPDVPDRVTPVAPLPDRGRVLAVLGLLLACCLFSAAVTLTDSLPLRELPPAVVLAIMAGPAMLYLVVIVLIAACRYVIRRPMAWMDERLVRLPDRAFVVFGFGVLVVAMCLVALIAVAGTGLSSDALMLTMVVSVGTLVAMGVFWLRNQDKTPDWPAAPARPTALWVQKALVDLDRRLDTWSKPLPLRHQREALIALSAIRGALATMSEPSSRTLLAWWRTRSPWITLPHSTLACAALALATTALVLHWNTGGPDLLSTVLWLGATLLTVGSYWGSLALEHRRDRWQTRTVAETTPARLAVLEARLAELSQPGLIAVRHRNESALPG